MTDAAFSPIWSILLILLGFVIVFPLFWLFVVGLIGQFGGWQRLAQRYRAPQLAQQSVTGKLWSGQYGFVNGARYGNALNITSNDIGLFIEAAWLFRFNHPPLFIPWRDLHNPQPTLFRQRHLIKVDVGQPQVGTLTLPVAIFDETEGRKVLPQSAIGTNVPDHTQ